MAPGVAGSIPVSHPGESTGWRLRNGVRSGDRGMKARSSIGRAPVSKTGGWGFDSLRPCRSLIENRCEERNAAVSSRGLGRSPLKAQTRVRIPLPLLEQYGRRTADGQRERPVRLSVRTAPFHGAERGSIPLRATVRGRTTGRRWKWQDEPGGREPGGSVGSLGA